MLRARDAACLGLLVAGVSAAEAGPALPSVTAPSTTMTAPALTVSGPATTTVTGEVIAARSRWTADRRNILTDAVVRTAVGDVDVVTLGGHVDGLTMAVLHGPPPLSPGLRVALTVHPTAAAAGRARWAVDAGEVLSAGAAGPWVRTLTNKTRTPVYWAKGCVQVARAAEGTSALAGDAEAAIVSASLATWNTGVAACSYLDLVDLGAVTGEVGNDGVNLIKFRDDTWCRPAVDGQEEHCFSHQASAITTLLFVDDADDDRDGEIIDADIELNGVDFAISSGGQSLSTAGCMADLANTLVHELGHLLGLGHTCLGPSELPRNDGAGQPVPLCTATSAPAIVDATMYPYQTCGETSKASLSADDTAALCAIYPTARDPGVCEGPDELGGGCCDQGGGGGRGAVALGLLVLAALRPRRRAVRTAPGW